ncbi:MAG TPA: DUF2480 family protein [Saprospiraceae bacterium]|nr:DUF2480 family protein [Saprospiraceae bacterium]
MNPNNVMSEALVNRIANSGLITLRPEEWAPSTQPSAIDLKDFLFKGLILKEQEFREMMKQHDWKQYSGTTLCVFCSADAIVPSWSYMLIASNASPFVKEIFFGTPQQWTSSLLLAHINGMDINEFKDQRVIIKGCSDDVEIGPEIYVALTNKLVPVVKSLMFGEPCSTVPVFKRSKEA